MYSVWIMEQKLCIRIRSNIQKHRFNKTADKKLRDVVMAERRRLPSLEPSKNSPLPSSPPSKKSKLSETDEDIGLEAEEEADISLETSEILSRSSSSEKDNSKENLEVDDPTPGPSKDKEDSQDVENSTKFLGRQIMGRKADGSLVGEHAHYQELSQIGDGAYGTVYKAKDLSSGQVVALKKVRVPLTEDGLPTSTLREIAGLKQLERFEHPNIVRLLDVCQGNYLQLPANAKQTESMNRGMILWLVFEHVEQDLASFISVSPPGGLSPHLIKQMSKEILLGVDFLHSHRIIHRDLKPQNLLVTRDGRIKIADFGLAKTYDFEMRLTSVVVTLWYRAPEVLLGCPYATPVDIWSIGCILAELNRLAPLFPGSSEGDELDRIFQVIGTPSQEEWPKNVSLSWTAFPQRRPMLLKNIIPQIDSDGLDLITNLLTFNPHVRLTAAQALQHRYFVDSS
ncbi:cyclin-dependent kinase 4 isoform X3 [Cotesia glomerata]|uniref:cyclin-dependent kinase 4 isoform X3 n=1 Tax=Cotesia glomerata TaxID=32391 RepID=UPI001D02F46A|nr:cyclin-dependent kinase 4 isoform X3 [Cotesia glomerata]